MPDDQLSDPNLDRIYQEVMRSRKWQEKHSGEGDGTTHDSLNKRVTRVEIIMGGLAFALTFIGSKIKGILG